MRCREQLKTLRARRKHDRILFTLLGPRGPPMIRSVYLSRRHTNAHVRTYMWHGFYFIIFVRFHVRSTWKRPRHVNAPITVCARRYSLRPSRVLPCKYPVNDAILVGYTSPGHKPKRSRPRVERTTVETRVDTLTKIFLPGGCVCVWEGEGEHA